MADDLEALPTVDNDITTVLNALARRGFLLGSGEARAVLAALQAEGWTKPETQAEQSDDGIVPKGGKRPPGPPPSPPVARKTPPAPPSSSGRDIGPHKLEALAKTLHAWDSTHLWTDVPGHERNVWLWKAQLAFEAMEAAEPEKPKPLDWCESCQDRHPPAMCGSAQWVAKGDPDGRLEGERDIELHLRLDASEGVVDSTFSRVMSVLCDLHDIGVIIDPSVDGSLASGEFNIEFTLPADGAVVRGVPNA